MANAGNEVARSAVEELQPTLAEVVAGGGGAAGAILARTPDGVEFRATAGLSQDAIEAYLSQWQRRDPWIAALRGPFAARVFRGEDLVGTRLLRASEFHSRWLAPNGLDHAIFAEIAEAGPTRDLLCVWRPTGSKSFSRSDARLVGAVAGMLGMLMRQSELAGGAAIAAELVAQSSVPIVLLRADGTIVWSNAAAASLWNGEGPLRRACGRLALRHTGHTARFAQSIASVAAPGGRPSMLGVQTEEGIVALRLQPLMLRSGGTMVALTGYLPGMGVPNAGTIAAALGLTRAQAEVAVLLCHGLETAAISARIGVSQHTLNGHLRDLYGRLRASNRVQAVVRVLGASVALTLLAPPGGVNNGTTEQHTAK